MKYTMLLVITILLAGCVGSPASQNPLEKRGAKLWWQRSTVGVKSADNPWEIYVAPSAKDTTDDPWGDFQEPCLFPEGWELDHRKDETIIKGQKKVF